MTTNADVTVIRNWAFQLATENIQHVRGCIKQLDDMDLRDLFLEILNNRVKLNVNWHPTAVASLKGRLETIAKNPVYIPGPKNFWASLLKAILNIFGRTSTAKLEQAIYMEAGYRLNVDLIVSLQGPNSYQHTGNMSSAAELNGYAKTFNQLNLISQECQDLESQCNDRRAHMISYVRAHYGAPSLRQIPQADFAPGKMPPEVFHFIRNQSPRS